MVITISLYCFSHIVHACYPSVCLINHFKSTHLPLSSLKCVEKQNKVV